MHARFFFLFSYLIFVSDDFFICPALYVYISVCNAAGVSCSWSVGGSTASFDTGLRWFVN